MQSIRRPVEPNGGTWLHPRIRVTDNHLALRTIPPEAEGAIHILGDEVRIGNSEGGRVATRREEDAYREYEPDQREGDKDDLVDVIRTGWEVSKQVGQPENGVEPERAPRPPLDAPIRHQHDQGPEKAESGRGETVRTIQGGVPTRRNDRDHDTKDEDGQANDREADPAYLHRQLHREHDVTLHRARELTARVVLTRNLLSHVLGIFK